MRPYEITLVAKSDDKETPAKVMEKLEALLKKVGGRLVKNDDWGIKTLAYPIKKQEKGHYLFLEIETTPANMQKVRERLQVEDDLLRYLVVLKP